MSKVVSLDERRELNRLKAQPYTSMEDLPDVTREGQQAVYKAVLNLEAQPTRRPK